MKEKLLNIAYLRCSKDEQDVSHQLDSIRKFCYNNNIIIDKTIEDEGVSAYSKSAYEREGFSEIVNLAKQNRINKLILFESSRLSRNFYEGQNLIKFFSDHRIEVYSVVDGGIINATELDNLLNSIRYWINQKSSKETSDRIKSQKKMAREKGEYLGHPVLLGFKVENKREVVDENMVPFIEELFETYINYSSKECIELLKSFGISATHQTLLQRLKNEKYIAIVGNDRFNQVQKTIQSRRCNNGAVTRSLNRSDVLYEGLLYHSCGRKLSIDRNRKGEPVFRCKKCKGNDSVSIKKSFTGLKLMSNINKQVDDIIKNLNRDELKARYNERNNKQYDIVNIKVNELNEVLKAKRKALATANNKLEKLLISDDSNTILLSTVANTISSMKDEIEVIESELLKEQNSLDKINSESEANDKLINKIIDLKTAYKVASKDKKKAMLNVMINKIIVYDIDAFDIYLKI